MFWDGADAERLVGEWRARVGFTDGDGPTQWGKVFAAGNGTSGRPVRDRVLRPLGVDPGSAWFTDIVNTYVVKTGQGQQGEAVELFNKLAARMELAKARLPKRPVPTALINLAATDHRDRLRAELLEASAPIAVTLGEEARSVLAAIGDRTSGGPTQVLSVTTTSDRKMILVGAARLAVWSPPGVQAAVAMVTVCPRASSWGTRSRVRRVGSRCRSW